MEQLPLYLPIAFGGIVLLSLYLFVNAHPKKGLLITVALGLILVQSILSINGFYTDTQSMPPRFGLLILPPLLGLILLFVLPKGRAFLQEFDLGALTLLHVVRLPVEIVLFDLAAHAMISPHMTFEGRNFDIVMGISAPLMWYLYTRKKSLSSTFLLIWNSAGILLLLNVVIHAILSVPTPFQQLSFEQPTIAPTLFPFTLLPGFVVPVVLWSQVITIWKLRKGERI